MPHNIYSRNPAALQQKHRVGPGRAPGRNRGIRKWRIVVIRKRKKKHCGKYDKKISWLKKRFVHQGEIMTKNVQMDFLCAIITPTGRCGERRQAGGRGRGERPGGIF